jgi:hypothetical protein
MRLYAGPLRHRRLELLLMLSGPQNNKFSAEGCNYGLHSPAETLSFLGYRVMGFTYVAESLNCQSRTLQFYLGNEIFHVRLSQVIMVF